MTDGECVFERVTDADLRPDASTFGGIANVANSVAAEGTPVALPRVQDSRDIRLLYERVREQRGAIFYARCDAWLVAFAVLEADASDERAGVVRVYVLPEYRRRGLGTELVEMAVQTARGLGYARLHGALPRGNPAALSFFGAVAPLVQIQAGTMAYELPLEEEPA